MLSLEEVKTYVTNAIEKYAPVLGKPFDEYIDYAEEFSEQLYNELRSNYFQATQEEINDIGECNIELVIGDWYYANCFGTICVADDFLFQRNSDLKLLKNSFFDLDKMYNFLLSNFLYENLS